MALPPYWVSGLDVSARKHLAALVRERRMAKPWNVRQMAMSTGISTAEISRIENAKKTDIPLSVLLTLQRAFDIASLEQLLGDFPSYGLTRRHHEEGKLEAV